jgi:hypothetical protein
MKKRLWTSLLFVLAALYDGVLGLMFLFFSGAAFQWYDVTPPNHLGYVHLPAALLLVFAIMFLVIALSPARNRNLIPYGILLKISYCGVVFYHWFTAGIPNMWKPLAIADLVFIVLFAAAFASIGKDAAAKDAAQKS